MTCSDCHANPGAGGHFNTLGAAGRREDHGGRELHGNGFDGTCTNSCHTYTGNWATGTMACVDCHATGRIGGALLGAHAGHGIALGADGTACVNCHNAGAYTKTLGGGARQQHDELLRGELQRVAQRADGDLHDDEPATTRGRTPRRSGTARRWRATTATGTSRRGSGVRTRRTSRRRTSRTAASATRRRRPTTRGTSPGRRRWWTSRWRRRRRRRSWRRRAARSCGRRRRRATRRSATTRARGRRTSRRRGRGPTAAA